MSKAGVQKLGDWHTWPLERASAGGRGRERWRRWPEPGSGGGLWYSEAAPQADTGTPPMTGERAGSARRGTCTQHRGDCLCGPERVNESLDWVQEQRHPPWRAKRHRRKRQDSWNEGGRELGAKPQSFTESPVDEGKDRMVSRVRQKHFRVMSHFKTGFRRVRATQNYLMPP